MTGGSRTVADLAATVRTRIEHTVRMKKVEVPTWSEALVALDELAARATQTEEECNKLRGVVGAAQDDKEDAEAEAARLREQLDALENNLRLSREAHWATVAEKQEEARDAFRLREELGEYRDRYQNEAGARVTDVDRLCEQRSDLEWKWKAAEARLGEAQARCAQLEQALRYMADYKMTGSEQTLHIDFQGKAREALAGPSVSEAEPDTPADSQEDKT